MIKNKKISPIVRYTILKCIPGKTCLSYMSPNIVAAVKVHVIINLSLFSFVNSVFFYKF